MMESPLTTSSSSENLEEFGDIDFNLLLSFDHEDEKELFNELEGKEGCGIAFPFSSSANEIIELDVFDEASLLSTSTDNEMSYQLTSIPLKVESNKKRCSKR